ncbi:S1/P1 nuclease [Pleionea sediminis]|uniref:S1/P1 nuclease n=1 Tax=Pleionea sediminis TaxID=2569479 RepID=UPI001186FB5A|nr:S1/P1 nuclease [Pleionea sediminis]
MRLFISILLLAVGQQCLAFGQNGHRIVAHIAEQNLNKTAKERISQLIQGVPLAKLSTWPDDIKSDERWDHTGPWHYISIADDESFGEVERSKEGDILKSLNQSEKTLSSQTASPQEKWQALAFYVHFVADIHQPFHVGRKDDRGGNDIKVSWFGNYSNLHRVWDTDLIRNQNMSYTEYADFIDDVSPDVIKQWQKSSYIDWAKESKELRATLYDFPQGGRLHYEFAYKNTPIINKRLAQAGFRLAAKLNTLFGEQQ